MSYTLELVTETKLRGQQDKIVRDGIISFNEPYTGSTPEIYSIYVKDDSDLIIGGAIVYAHKNSIYVDVLWVNEEHQS